MSAIHASSKGAFLSHLLPFKVPPTQVSIQADITREARPIQQINSGGPLEFNISPSEDLMIILSETYFNTRLKIKITKTGKSDAYKKDDWKNVKARQNFMHSLFRSADLTLGNQQVTKTGKNYAYKAWFETFFSMSENAKKSYLQNVGSFEEESKRWEFLATDSSETTVEVRGRLHFDLTFQERAIIGKLPISIKLNPNPGNFFLDVADGYVVEFEFVDPYIDFHMAKLTDVGLKTLQNGLSKMPAKYPIARDEIIALNIPQGFEDFMQDNIVMGQMPRRLFVGLVSAEAYNGNFKKDPFKFEHCNISEICVYVNSICYPSRPFKPNFAKNLFAREHMSVYTTSNQNMTDTYLVLPRDVYKEHKTLFGFNFAPDQTSGPGSFSHANLIENGAMRICIRFNSRLPENMKAIVFMEFDNIIEIDETRNVTLDY